MKKTITTLALCFALGTVWAQDTKPSENKGEMRTVCNDVRGKDGKPVMDPKTGKPRQDCRQIKVRKKYEGTTVPGQK